jgi:formiminoglutamase
MADTLRFIRADTVPVATDRKGRRDDPRMASRMVSLADEPKRDKVHAIVLGVADDRGVHLNGGRLGAADGPARFRDYFGRLPAPAEFGPHSVLNAGDLMPAESTNETHARLAEVVFVLRERFPLARLVVVGGGHDHAYGEVLGLARSVAALDREAKVAVLNVDAHADVRPHHGEPHSGTPFRRILTEPATRVAAGSLVEWGLQHACNATAHLQYLQQQGARVVFWEDIDGSDTIAGAQLLALLTELATGHAGLSLSVDMDAFAQAVSPGVSAPSPLGVPAGAVVRAAAVLGSLPTSTQLGIYELNPRFDQDGASARLAARLAWSYVTGLV